MSTVRASAALHARGRHGSRSRLLLALLLPPATALGVLGLSLLLLFTPFYLHAALDMAGSPAEVRLTTDQAHQLSDRTVAELFVGPGTFDFRVPDGRRFYDAAEAAHLRDVRLVLFAFLALAGLSSAAVAGALLRRRHDPHVWSSVARGGAGLAVVLIGLGIFAAVAFDAAFELFHRLLFPGGNWAFDPGTQRLVQLYPLAFWQLTAAALGVLAVGLGLAVWALARRRVDRLQRDVA